MFLSLGVQHFIVNHIPSNVNLSYLSDIESILRTLNSNDNLILLGDFNYRDAPNMLKNLPIIPSRTSQNVSLLFFKIPPIIPTLIVRK